jgi:uroporphyrinogen decarboxylase
MPEMTPRERIEPAITGAALDRPPVSLWMHFPDRDQTAADLAAVTLDWQARFGFDFIKLMPPGDYMMIGWGPKASTGETRTRCATRSGSRLPP